MGEKILVTVDYYNKTQSIYCQLTKQSRRKIMQADIQSSYRPAKLN